MLMKIHLQDHEEKKILKLFHKKSWYPQIEFTFTQLQSIIHVIRSPHQRKRGGFINHV